MSRITTITSVLSSMRELRGLFVGKVDAADAYVELIVGSGGALAYVSREDGGGEWAGGRLHERRFRLVSRSGIRLDGEVRRRGVRGKLQLPRDDQARTFSAAPLRRAGEVIAA